MEETKDVRWEYVLKSLELLNSLKESLKSVEDSDLNLSVNQQQNVSSIIQLAVALGIVPSLLPGVGLPLSKRSKFYEIVSKEQELSVLQSHERLVKTTKSLLKLLENPTLSQIILTKHLGDILASLIQLSSAPLKKPDDERKENSDFVMTTEKYEELSKEQAYFKGKNIILDISGV